eukprot:793114-Rhodomonas_salina.1
MTSWPQRLAATNSASAELRVVHACLFAFRATGPLFKLTTYPVTERRVSGSAAKSESTQPMRTFRRSAPGSLQ